MGSDAAWSALELAGVSSRRRLRCDRVSGEREGGRRKWTRPELMSGARDDVRAPNVAVGLTPVGHVDELGFHSDKAMVD